MTTARRFKTSAIASVAIMLLVAVTGVASAAPRRGPAGLTARAAKVGAPAASASSSDEGDAESQELMDRSEQYAAVRTAPAASVSAEAFQAAARQAAALPATPGTWQELTNVPYNSDAVGYRDPFWSNSSGGSGLVSGRMSAIVSDGDVVYAGAADGGVWKSTDHGAHWAPIFDKQTRLSIGAIAVDPADHSVWVGTGEANTAFENYQGDGIYRSANAGHTWQLVGNRLDNSLVSRITFDGYGHVYAATAQVSCAATRSTSRRRGRRC